MNHWESVFKMVGPSIAMPLTAGPLPLLSDIFAYARRKQACDSSELRMLFSTSYLTPHRAYRIVNIQIGVAEVNGAAAYSFRPANHGTSNGPMLPTTPGPWHRMLFEVYSKEISQDSHQLVNNGAEILFVARAKRAFRRRLNRAWSYDSKSG